MDNFDSDRADTLLKSKTKQTLEYFTDTGVDDLLKHLRKSFQQDGHSEEEVENLVKAFMKMIALHFRHVERFSLAYDALLLLVIAQSKVSSETKLSRVEEISDYLKMASEGLHSLGKRWRVDG